MAVSAAFEEAIRLVLETRGAEDVEALQQAVAELGDVSAETVADTSKLVNELVDLNEAASKAGEFERLVDELAQTEAKMVGAQEAAYQLALQLKATEKPSKEMVQAQKQARAESDRLEASYAKQWAQLEKVESELKQAGVNTANLGAVQRELRNQIGSTAAAIDRQAQAVRNEAAAVQQLKQRMADGDDALRKQAEASRAAGESLRAYRERAAAAEKETRQVASAATTSSGALRKLSAVAAGLTGWFSVRGAWDATKQMLGLGDAAEMTRTRLNRLYGEGGGDAAFEKIRTLARDAGQQFDGLLQSALKLKSFGLEPLDGTLQGLLDQNALLGGSMETLDGLILGVGQAWAKQKLQGEEILQLVERGVPVWDLLSKATGKNVQELQRLSSAGQLGRDVMRQLLDEMAKSAYGAAAEGVNTLSRLWARLIDNLQGFGRKVADSGALDYVRAQVQQLLAVFDRAANDGSLDTWAKRVSDALVMAARAAQAGVQWIARNADAIVLLGKTYAAFKIGQAILAMNQWRIALMAATRAQMANSVAMGVTADGAWKLGSALRAIPTSLKIGVALVGVELAIRYAADLGEWLAKNGEAGKALAEAEEKLRLQMIKSAAGYADGAKALEQYYHQQVLNTEQAAALSDTERESYAERLKGLKAYLVQLHMYYLSMQEAGALVPEMADKWKQVQERLAGVNQGLKDLAAASAVAGQAMKNGISASAQLIIDQLKGIDGDAKAAVESIKKLFEGVNFAESNKLGDIGTALAQIAGRSAEADRNIRDGLLKSLQQMSGEELLRFQVAAQSAFDGVTQGQMNAAAVLDQTLVAAMEKLGISAERMGVKFTAAGRDATAAFSAILENANATSAQIEVAFKAALSKVATLDEAKALGAVLEAAGQQGKVGFDQAERAAAALNARINQITNAMDPLADEFGRLGITSQASLNAARDAAKDAFNAIRKGAAEGKASIEDVRRAMKAYGDAARAAVADSDAHAKARVQSEMEMLEAIYDVNGALEQMGATGSEAGSMVAAGAGDAASALQEVAATATAAQSAVSGVGSAASGAASDVGQATSSLNGFAFSIGEVSQKALDSMRNLGDGGNLLAKFVSAYNSIYYQRQEMQAYTQDLQTQIDAINGLDRAQAKLAQRYDLVGKQELAQAAQLQKQLQDARAAQQAERQRVADEERKANEQRLKLMKEAEAAEKNAGEAMNADEQRLVIDWRAPSKGVAASASAEDMAQAERLAALVAPLVMQRIERSRSVSIRRGAGR